MPSTNKGMSWKQKRHLKKEQDPRWSARANRLRSEKLTGRTLPLEVRAEMSATRRNPGQDPGDPNWDQELWERDRQAYIEQIQNRETILDRIDDDPDTVIEQLTDYLDLFYHQLRGVLIGDHVGTPMNIKKLRRMVEQGRLDDVLAMWVQDHA